MTSSWPTTDLSTRFRSNTLARVARMYGLLESVRSASSPAATESLCRDFHALIGLGGTYGYPTISELAEAAEQRLRIASDEGNVSGEIVDTLRKTIDVIAGEIHRESENVRLAEPAAVRESKRNVDVLMVEDEPLAPLIERLNRQGMKVRVTGSVAEGIAEVNRKLPDALIADVLLPDGNGCEVIEHLRGLPDGDITAAIATSVRTGFAHRLAAIRCGADAWFDKPLDPFQVAERIDLLLDRAAGHRRILSMEDDPAQAVYLRTVLERAGYEVRVCDDANAFAAVLSEFEPDLILMDLTLAGGVSGADLARYVRQDARWTVLPILFLTARREAAATLTTIHAGGDDHLTKPVSPQLLIASVRSRIERARQLRRLLERDGLTGLLTRAAFLGRAEAAMTTFRREPWVPMALVMLDLDHFKVVNDTWGHPTGDRVLRGLGSMLRRRLRGSDAVGRYGGEEIVILLRGASREEVDRLLKRLLADFQNTVYLADDGTAFHLSFSAGVSMLSQGVQRVEEWVAAADDAMYQAKRAGRATVVFASVSVSS